MLIKRWRIDSSAKPKQRDPSRKQAESIDIMLDPPQISPDSPFNIGKRLPSVPK